MASFFFGPDPLQSTFLIPGGNTPATGAQVFIYVAGSVSTKTTVYKDNAGNTAWSNPIVLDSGGNLPSGGVIWIPSGVTIKAVWAPSNDTDPPSSPYRTIDNIAGINDTTGSQTEWVTGPAPTFVSGTQFTLVGDQTSTFTKGRRLKFKVTAGTVFGVITGSAFGALTTIDVAFDSGALDSGFSAVSYSVISPTNSSIGADYTYKFATTVPSSGSGTTNIWGIAGDYTHITGTNTISSFSSAPYPGAERTVVIDGALTLSHNSPTLQMPGGASVTTAANDRFVVRADSVSTAIITNYAMANGFPIVGAQTSNTVFAGPVSGAAAAPTFRNLVGAESALILLSTKTANATSSISFGTSDVNWTAYDHYQFKFTNLRPANDGQGLLARFSIDGGASFLSDANYNYAYQGFTTGNASNNSGSTNVSGVLVVNSVGTSASFLGMRGTLDVFAPSTAMFHSCAGVFHYFDTAAVEVKNSCGTYVGTTTALTGIQFLFQIGNITSGTIRAYGVRNS